MNQTELDFFNKWRSDQHKQFGPLPLHPQAYRGDTSEHEKEVSRAAERLRNSFTEEDYQNHLNGINERDPRATPEALDLVVTEWYTRKNQGRLTEELFRRYDFRASWQDRGRVLEDIAKGKGKISKNLLADLAVIEEVERSGVMHGGNSYLAREMLRSYKEKGNFSLTDPWKDQEAKRKMLESGIKTDYGYDATAEYYSDRESAVVKRAFSGKNLSGKELSDLRGISEVDDDWRVRELASAVLSYWATHKSLKGISKDLRELGYDPKYYK